jgi:hypothetical protein
VVVVIFHDHGTRYLGKMYNDEWMRDRGFIQDEKNGENGEKSCCAPSMTLETIEIRAPMVKGFAYGFYLFFSTVFGLLVSIGFATIC